MHHQPRQVPRPGWRPKLIIDDAKFVSLLCKAKNSEQEVLSAAAVHPTGPEDQMRCSARCKRALAGQFARPVHAKGTREIGLEPRRIPGTVKNVVSRAMD